MNDDASFGQWLKLTRRTRDLSREALAERLNCAPATLAKIEQGSRRPSRELAALIVDALDVPPDERVEILRLARWHLSQPRSEPEDQDGGAGDLASASRPGYRRTSQLPAAVAPLIGRAGEQAQLLRYLADPNRRLITLVGPGGMGKTRLALQVAADAASHFPHGIAWVELDALGAETQVAPAIAEAVGCALAGMDAPEQQLLAWLRERRLLIVLDNFEHLPEAAPLVAAMVRQAPGITLLATSRERLRVAGEWVVDLPGLAFPDERSTLPDSPIAGPGHTADLERYDAVLLFLARARQVRHDFALTPANRSAVALICRLLDGMPLGIELAAGWTRTLTCQEIAGEIARSLDFLARADRDAPSRHHSMRAVFDHSWRLLTEDERRVLAALSVFKGGFRHDAAAQVGGATLATLAALVDKSLLRVTEQETGASRYDLHALIRQYAADRLREDEPAQEAVAERHGRYYAAMVEQRLPDLLSATRPAAFATLEPELANLRQAWAWAVSRRDTAAFRMMAQAVQAIFEDGGWLREGAALFAEAVQALRSAEIAGARQRDVRTTLGMVLGRHGYFLSRCGQFGAASELLRESLALLEEGEPSLALADTLMNLGVVAYQRGEYAAARGWLRQSVTIAERLHARFFEALGHCFLGAVALAQGEYADARTLLEWALAIERVNGQPRGLAVALSFLGRTAIAQGRLPEAQALLRESLSICSAAGDSWGAGYTFHHLAMLALAQGDAAEARYLQREAVDIFEMLGERWAQGQALAGLGDAAHAQGDTDAAHTAFVAALRLVAEEELLPVALHALLGIATAYVHDRRPAEAYALAVAICHHPAADDTIRRRADRMRGELAGGLSAATRAAIEEHERSAALEQFIAQGLA